MRLGRIGYLADHRTGSHIILRNEHSPYRRLTVPNHKEIARFFIDTVRNKKRPVSPAADVVKDIHDSGRLP